MAQRQELHLVSRRNRAGNGNAGHHRADSLELKDPLHGHAEGPLMGAGLDLQGPLLEPSTQFLHPLAGGCADREHRRPFEPRPLQQL